MFCSEEKRLPRRKAFWAVCVIISASSRIISLNPELKIFFVLAKFLICSRTTSIPRSSEALSYYLFLQEKSGHLLDILATVSKMVHSVLCRSLELQDLRDRRVDISGDMIYLHGHTLPHGSVKFTGTGQNGRGLSCSWRSVQ